MRPSDQYAPALDTFARALLPIAQAAKAAGDLDRAALQYAVAAYDCATQWRRDLTETARRRAAENAAACEALAVSPLGRAGSLTRQALAAYGAAMRTLCDAQPVRAMQAAKGAAGRLYA